MMIFRKMLKNKWLVMCLLLGLVIATALIASIPIYTQAVLEKYLIKEMENYQIERGGFPGGYMISVVESDDLLGERFDELIKKGEPVFKDQKVIDFYSKRLRNFSSLDHYIRQNTEKFIGLPVLARVVNYAIDKRKVESLDTDKHGTNYNAYADIESLSDFEEHIALIDGRFPSKEPVDGVYEVLVSEVGLNKLNILLNETLLLKDTNTKINRKPIRVRPVGVYKVTANNDPYWSFMNPSAFDESFMINEELMVRDFIKIEPTLIYFARWYYAFDYHAFTIGNLNYIIGGHGLLVKTFNYINGGHVSVDAPFMTVAESYRKKSIQLTNMMWSLNVPVIIMLCLYLFMVSRLIIERERNEIALFTSRGANQFQIVIVYLTEGLIFGIIAFFAGPGLGMIFGKVLGASNGFLQFADRKSLPIRLNKDVFIYTLTAIGISLVAMLIPAYTATKTSIVSHKQNISRRFPTAVWQKYFMDIAILAVAAYGYYTFIQRQKIMKTTGASAADIQVDPLLFLAPAFFIIGMGLLFLRLYPLLVKGIYWLGKKYWSPPIYITLTQVGRSLKSYHFLMIFLIMTLSIGIFSATAARTINLNAEERIYYANGCDMVVEAIWDNDAPKGGGPVRSVLNQNKTSNEIEIKPIKRVQYFEPSYLPYTQLSGVEHTARVFTKESVSVEYNNQNIENVNFMAIEPYEFGNVVWYRNGLLPHHINDYLNLLTGEPSACLISSSMSKAYKIKCGDSIRISWQGTDEVDFTVYGIVDYWPSWNPNRDPNQKDEGDPMLVVSNLQYTQDHLGLEPYKVWMKLKPGATSKQVYDSIKEKKLALMNLEDANMNLIKQKNDPFQLAINGALSLGFIISGFISFFGFMLYWILSINSRILQFGIYRAMGLSVRQLIGMIFWEQALTSGVAIAAGVFIGLFSSRLFVPFFQIAFDAFTQVPPFKVVAFLSDRIKIYVLVGSTMVLCLGILGLFLSRIKISQAIKLGEE